ncbi:MAG: hypothetical protein ACQESK_00925 [Bacteroidota bacterium]
MYKQYLKLILFLMGFSVAAQETESGVQNAINKAEASPVEEIFSSIYFSFGGQFSDDYQINRNLFQAEIPTIGNSGFYVGMGFSLLRDEAQHKRLDFEVGGFSIRDRVNDLGNKYVENQFQLRYEHKFASLEGGSFFAVGLQLNYSLAELELYDRSSEVNLDDLSTFGANTQLENKRLFVGPVLSFNWKHPRDEKVYARFLFNYEFAVANGSWDSSSTTVNNAFRESGHRFQMRVIIPVFDLLLSQ